MASLLNYNRSANNIGGSALIALNGTPVKLAEFGLFVSQPTNFVELIATVGWTAEEILVGAQSQVEFFITQDIIRVVSTNEEPPSDGGDIDIFQTTTFQGVLTNVSAGHHVYRLYAQNLEPGQSTVNIVGPITISGKVIAP